MGTLLPLTPGSAELLCLGTSAEPSQVGEEAAREVWAAAASA